MHVVDASVWVSGFSQAESQHTTSLSWFRQNMRRGEMIAVPTIVLAEISGALARSSGDVEKGLAANSMVQRLYFVRFVSVDARLGHLGAVTASTYRLRGCDALYVALALRLGVPLITWDREQRERGSGIIQAMTPEEALGT